MFKRAKAIWLEGKEKEKNIQAKFVASFGGLKNPILIITGATFYRIYLNGRIIHYGPAPAAYGYARVDAVELKGLQEESNTIIIEAAGYNCYSYAAIKQTSFVQAEILDGEEVICATGFDFKGYYVPARSQKTLRYSFQRHFTEVWDMSREDVEQNVTVLNLPVKHLKRKSPLPDMGIEKIETIYARSKFVSKKNDWELPGFFGAVGEKSDRIDLFENDEIAEKPILRFKEFEYAIRKKEECFPSVISKNEYAVFECRVNTCGLINLKYKASSDCKILIVFDEKLVDGKFDYRTWESFNVIEIKTAESIEFTNFEVYGFKFFGVFVIEGTLEIKEANVIKVINPIKDIPVLNCEDEKVIGIYEAACQSARCNTLGNFMDCPTRERAGWLCDSYYTAQAMFVLMGNTDIEDDFIENYLLADGRWLPKGMLPMCYPADHTDCNYIPQWALWYILQVDQYRERNRSISIDTFKELAYGLLGYFEKYENEFGLLEDLGGWNFVEWSKANDWTKGINFPTNMLYSKVLKIIGGWFDDNSLLEKAKKLKEKIIEMSFDGRFFRDQALRNNENTPVICEHISEVCQYYAFMFDIADRGNFKELYNILVTEFTPESGNWKNIEKVNALMGAYMRMELLSKWSLNEQLVEEIKKFFGHMAEITGTLWENKYMTNSLNHGFTSYLVVLLLKIFNNM